MSARETPITVLVVDDETLVLNMCSAALSHAGYNVVTASDAMLAIKMCREVDFRIDLALIDAIMPAMSGPELEDCLVGLGIKVLIMSGYPESEIFERVGRKLRAGAFLPKPFTQTILLEAVERVLTESTRRPAAE